MLYFNIKIKRFLSIDLARIIAAVAVVIIHVVSNSYFLLSDIGYRNWVMTSLIGWLVIWGTPLFIMISGFLLINPKKTENFKQFILKRSSRILIPLIFWNIFYYLFDHNFKNVSLNEFFYQISHTGTYSHLYFLNILIGLYLITPFLSKLVTKINLNLIIPFLVTISSLYHFSYCFLNFPKFNNIFTIYLPYISYYLAGYWVGHKLKIKHFKMVGLFIFLLFVFSVFITRKLVFIFETHDQDTILVSNLSLPVAAFTIVLFYWFISITNKILEKKSLFLIKISNLTLGVYLIHPFWLKLFKSIPIYSYLLNNYYYLWFITVTFSVLFISFFSAYIIKKIPLLKKLF